MMGISIDPRAIATGPVRPDNGGVRGTASPSTIRTHREALTDARERLALSGIRRLGHDAVVGIYEGAVAVVPAVDGRVGLADDDFGYPSIVPLEPGVMGIGLDEAIDRMAPYAEGRLGAFDGAGGMLENITLGDDGSVTLEYECGHVWALPAIADGHPPRVVWQHGCIVGIGNGPEGQTIDNDAAEAIRSHLVAVDAHAELHHTQPRTR